ncbi:hypothetical protein PPMP20_01825 [Paraburkholderia phymatum]|uniref:Uncharacterized protein n=1 Tax=Paraburkholderia phymatum (strain DSM 17167 / CIP 108236 / LMG 21445 / STM815) TaxID=391038 RepID=B2JW65_PARP8|nr:hypothetical protein [Paraburkholderia phymatum]ACC75192.1 hypothetical protein Bphy_6137 [Paraburkholderia phymatum STM815]
MDAKKDRWRLTACFYDKAFDNAAHAEGFLQYGSLSQENKEMVGEDLPDNALVYVSGNWTYPTHNIEIGDFDVYEADRALCHDAPPPFRGRIKATIAISPLLVINQQVRAQLPLLSRQDT